MVEGTARIKKVNQSRFQKLLGFFLKLSTLGFAAILIRIVVLADMGTLPRFTARLYRIPYADKAGHFILFGILTLLINLSLFYSYPKQDPKRLILTSGLFLAFLMAVEEFSQRFFANRTFDLSDLAAGCLGVIFFSLIAIGVHSLSKVWGRTPGSSRHQH